MPQFLFRLPVRIYALAALAVGLAAALTFVLLSRAVDNAYEMREKELSSLTDAVISSLANLDEQVQAGTLTLEEAQEQGKTQIELLRFGSVGYFFAFDENDVMRAHAVAKQLIGNVQTDFEDVNGVLVFQEFNKVIKEKGSGAVIYHFNKPDSEIPQAKMGYVKAFAPWKWIIGTGAYVEDIEAELNIMRWTALSALAISLAILAIGATVITRSVTVPVTALNNRMRTMAEGDTDADIPATNNKSEIGDMARRLELFRQSLIRQKELEGEQKEREAEQVKVVSILSSSLSKLSQGDLTVKITSDFPEDYSQLRRDFNQTTETLSGTMSRMVEATTSIRNGAAEISQASDDLSHRTESQAATLEETAAALDELTASVKSAAEGARSVEATMEAAKQEAEVSGEVVQSAVSAMTEIEQSSNHISQIISVIDDIAFQTNLLALNAGVEAARAGEAGKGFAVVASEVRALAQRSSDAAMEIKTLIGDSSKQVARGVDLVGKAGEALESIVGQVSHISKLVSGIAEGAVEQSTGLNEINTGVTQLDQVTQQNAAMVEEATAAGHLLNTDSSKLAELVAIFKVDGSASVVQMPTAASSVAPVVAPSAHGNDDWDLAAMSPAPTPVRVGSDGNTAKDMWQDF
ncbi:methyl-accepting chemotaxis protein [Pseudophaeobacter arcticus]|jgi:methyl-accepting chemotaxis protein|uniref:methyl-accepting chemotaxis protein n=3 Tax=Pseudophaeobacter arcticus TaxID=385492 RepID=UPI0004843E1B|nr:methyl-accepting chemotaxis protein [Pseudophaeobacter arcticus]